MIQSKERPFLFLSRGEWRAIHYWLCGVMCRRGIWVHLPRDEKAFAAAWFYVVQSRRWSRFITDNDPNDMLLLRGTGWLYRWSWRAYRLRTVKYYPQAESMTP